MSGTNLVKNNGIMRDYDVIKCESDCAISQIWVFNSEFRGKIDHMVARSTRF